MSTKLTNRDAANSEGRPANHKWTSESLKYFIIVPLTDTINESKNKTFTWINWEFQEHISYDDLSKLSYIKQILFETLRIYPPAPRYQKIHIFRLQEYYIKYTAENICVFSRICFNICTVKFKFEFSYRFDRETVSNTNVGNICLTKNCVISVPLFALHYNETVFPEPNKFDPDRYVIEFSKMSLNFTRSSKSISDKKIYVIRNFFDFNSLRLFLLKSKFIWYTLNQTFLLRFTDEKCAQRDPLAFLPFGIGPRSCLGKRFAIMEFQIIMARLLIKYRFIPCELTPVCKIKVSEHKKITRSREYAAKHYIL